MNLHQKLLDEKYMFRAILLASQAGIEVKSNPKVGCVLVANSRIIGEGRTQAFGGHHAEVMAIQSVMESDESLISKATAYVTLEPCSHFGKTPPCADLLIKKGLKKVIISHLDPFAKVNGQGIEKLKTAGIEVEVGLLEKESEFLLLPFKKWIKANMPYITLKWAQSEDIFYGKKDKQVWLSNEYAKLFAHKLRSAHDAILIGTNTYLIDKPQLNNRYWWGSSPIKVLIDRQSKIDFSELKEEEVIVYSEVERPEFLKELSKVIWRKMPLKDNNLALIFKDLGTLGYFRILVEGGAAIQKSCIQYQLWDEAIVFKTQKILQSGIKAPLAEGLLIEQFQLSDNEVVRISSQNS